MMHRNVPWTDTQLLTQIGDDNHDAFKMLYERYWPELFDAAYKRLKKPELAEDMVQEVFAHLYKKRKSLTITTTLAAYLHTVLKYKVLDEVRKHLVRNRYRDEWLHEPAQRTGGAEPGDLLEEKEIQALVDAAGMQMPDRCREVFLLRHLEQLSYKEIAKRLAISEKTVEGHLHRARQILKRHFRNYPINFILLIASVLP